MAWGGSFDFQSKNHECLWLWAFDNNMRDEDQIFNIISKLYFIGISLLPHSKLNFTCEVYAMHHILSQHVVEWVWLFIRYLRWSWIEDFIHTCSDDDPCPDELRDQYGLWEINVAENLTYQI